MSTPSESREIATIYADPPALMRQGNDLILTNMGRMLATIHKSGMAPSTLNTPEKLTVAAWHGAKLGLDIMSAIQAIYVVNGRPTIWGDTMLALCQRSPVWDGTRFSERIEGTGDAMAAICEVARVNCPVVRGEFSVEDAKLAGIWGKAGPWKQFPKRMLKARARAYALRDCFADILAGFYAREEMEMDSPLDVEAQPVERRTPTPSGPGPMAKVAAEIRNPSAPTIPAQEPAHVTITTAASAGGGIAPLSPGVADHEADYPLAVTGGGAMSPPAAPPAPSRDEIMSVLRQRLSDPRPHPDQWDAWIKWMVAAIFINAEGEHTDLEPAAVKVALDNIWGEWNDSNRSEDMNFNPVFEPWSAAQMRRFAIGKDNLDGIGALADAFYGAANEAGWIYNPETKMDFGPVVDGACRGGAN